MAIGGEESVQVVDICIYGYYDGHARSLVAVNRSPTFFKPTSPFEYAGSQRTFITKHLFNFRKILVGFSPESIKNLITTRCSIFESITFHNARNRGGWISKFVKNHTNVLLQQKNTVDCLQSVHSRRRMVACAVLPHDLKKNLVI